MRRRGFLAGLAGMLVDGRAAKATTITPTLTNDNGRDYPASWSADPAPVEPPDPVRMLRDWYEHSPALCGAAAEWPLGIAARLEYDRLVPGASRIIDSALRKTLLADPAARVERFDRPPFVVDLYGAGLTVTPGHPAYFVCVNNATEGEVRAVQEQLSGYLAMPAAGPKVAVFDSDVTIATPFAGLPLNAEWLNVHPSELPERLVTKVCESVGELFRVAAPGMVEPQVRAELRGPLLVVGVHAHRLVREAVGVDVASPDGSVTVVRSAHFEGDRLRVEYTQAPAELFR